MSKHLIVIGGVAAGAKTAAKARRHDDDLKITLYTQEELVSYSGCGLPYYISDVIKEKGQLILKTPAEFRLKQGIDVKILHQITKIDPAKKEVHVLNLKTNETFTDKYDYLMIGTGARPFVPPIEGKDLNNVHTLRYVEDSETIKKLIDTGKHKKAVIVGGGLIGMECAEAFKKRGLEVTVIELADQILTPIDKDMAEIVEKHCIEKGINIITSDGVKKLVGDENDNVCKVITNHHEIEADLVLLSIGIKPGVDIAVEAGIELGTTKAIKVNSKMQTNIPDIYAAGDCVESTHIITKQPVWMPLGSVANKQARVAAINITGGHDEFRGVLGTLIVKVFDLNIAKTGVSEKEAQKHNINYVTTTIKGNALSGYYPGNKILTIKLLAEKETHKVIGCEVIGEGAADKRIDVVAMGITAGITVEELEQLDLAYAPPYSMATEALLVAASGLIKKLSKEIVKS